MARPVNFTDDQIEDALRKAGGVQVLAAQALEEASANAGVPRSCSRQMLSARVKASQRLQDVIAEVKETTLDIAEAQAIKKINEGSEYSIWKYLEMQGKHRGYTRRVENTGADGAPLTGPATVIILPDNGRDPDLIQK